MTTIIAINLILSAIIVAAVAGVVWLAHRLPVLAPRSDERWGIGGDPWVPSAPLPLQQVARHEDEHGLDRAA